MIDLPPPHVSAEDLAALAEGGDRELDREAILTHLSTCRSCMSAYADAVRYRAAWLADPHLFRPPAEVVRWARDAVPSPTGPRAASHEPVAKRSHRARLAVAMGLMVAITVWVALGLGVRDEDMPLPDPIRAAITRASAAGLVLPGGEAGCASEPPRLRSGTPAAGAGLGAAVELVRARYEAGDRTADAAYALAAGLMETGQYDAARGYVEDARRRTRPNYRLCVLAADLAYRSSDLHEAERELRSALSARPADRVASLNLAMVLAEQGRRDDAIHLLKPVSRGSDALAVRARRELSAIRGND